MATADGSGPEFTYVVRGAGGDVWALINIDGSVDVQRPVELAVGADPTTLPLMFWKDGVLLRKLAPQGVMATVYLSDNGRLFDVNTSMWLNDVPTNCDIPATGVRGFTGTQPSSEQDEGSSANAGFEWDREKTVLDYWRELSSHDTVLRALTSSTKRRVQRSTRPRPDTVGAAELTKGSLAEALVVGHLPGDLPLQTSRVAAPDVTVVAPFVNPADASESGLTPQQAHQILLDEDGGETFARCMLLGDCQVCACIRISELCLKHTYTTH